MAGGKPTGHSHESLSALAPSNHSALELVLQSVK